MDILGGNAEKEVESIISLGGDFHAEGNPEDRPLALPLKTRQGRKRLALKTRSAANGIVIF